MYQDITVAVPVERIPEFYMMFSDWLKITSSYDKIPQAWGPDDTDRAILVYAKLSKTARDILNQFLDTPDKDIPAEKVAAKAKIGAGSHGLAGTLAWPGRYCDALGKKPFLNARVDEEKGTFYSMPAQVADLIKHAKEVVG